MRYILLIGMLWGQECLVPLNSYEYFLKSSYDLRIKLHLDQYSNLTRTYYPDYSRILINQINFEDEVRHLIYLNSLLDELILEELLIEGILE